MKAGMDSTHNKNESSKDLFLDIGRLRIKAEEKFLADLDRSSLEREKAHRAALESAAAEHERVRQSAEVARQRFEHETQKEIKRRQDEERKELDRIRQEKADRELVERRQEIETARKKEVQRIKIENEARARAAAAAAENQRKADEERQDAERRRQRAQEERERVEQRDREAAAAEAKMIAEQQRLYNQEAPATKHESSDGKANGTIQSTQVLHSARSLDSSDKEAIHLEYRKIHQRLKEMRKNMMDFGRQHLELKKRMGDMRREIRKCVGQCTEGRGANRGLINRIQAILNEALNDTSGPQVDVRPFISAQTLRSLQNRNPEAAHASSTLPGLLIYLLNIFSKAIIAQFISEASVSPKAADPVGIVAVQMFAVDDFRWYGTTLIDILMAKYHVVCPVLWGIYGDEKTNVGKGRLGWGREDRDGPWVSEQRHGERMTGLGAGFGAIALRNFSRSKNSNPYPNHHYWQAMQQIVSVPAAEATKTHFFVLKAMTEHYESRFLTLYGNAALAALRKALLDFPHQAGESGKTAAARALTVLPDLLKRNQKLTLGR